MMSKAPKTAVKEDIRSLTGAERAAIIMLSLGEDHSQHAAAASSCQRESARSAIWRARYRTKC